MADIDGWLARKYNIQEQQANTAALEAQARVRQLDQQTKLAPGIAASQEAQAYGSAAASTGQGALARTTASTVPGTAASENLLRGSQAGLYGTQSRVGALPLGGANPLVVGSGVARAGQGGLNIPSYASPGLPMMSTYMDDGSGGSPASSNGTGDLGAPKNFDMQGRLLESTGTSKVPGKGSGKVDTQKAMLAPGEAVLNKAAAEHLGRNTIDLLNAIGRQKMGVPDDPNSGDMSGGDQTAQGTTQGYAGGTPDVGMYGDRPPYTQQWFHGSKQSPHDVVAEFQTATPSTPAADDYVNGTGKTKTPGTGASSATPGYAKGTSKVPGKSAAATAKPNKAGAKPGGKAPAGALTPGILQALMQMGGGGGGAPPMGGMPGGAAPMPMPMPPTMPMR